MTILKNDVTILKGNNNNNKLTLDSNNKTQYLKRKNSGNLHNSLVVVVKRLLTDDMLNGYKNNTTTTQQQHQEEEQNILINDNNGDIFKDSPVATLSNMGYTCYLNSVLYALRFTPAFLHNLHHLIGDLTLIYARLSQTKAKTSSLGRNISSLSGGPAGGSNRSTSSKDLLNLNNVLLDNNTTTTTYKTKVQIVTEKLHELFVTMHNLEVKESTDPIQPSVLLQAIRDANAIFEGNHQQDAHELFLYLLDNLRETCDLLTQQVTNNPQLLIDSLDESVGIPTTTTTTTNNSKLWNCRRSWKFNYKSKKEKNHTKEAINEEILHTTNEEPTTTTTTTTTETQSNETVQQQQPRTTTNNKKQCYNFVEDFEGVTLCRTKCLECESVTERKECFYDIPVPVKEISFDANFSSSSIEQHFLNSPQQQPPQTNPSDLFRLACVTTEKLSDSNKYLCETCNRYNEAIREVVFEKLPNIMVFQLKRFTTATSGGAPQKLNTYMPTPLDLKCFCELCCNRNDKTNNSFINNNNNHHYELCSVIMHLGDTMYSGHYIAYVRAQQKYCTTDEYLLCQRDHNNIIGKNPTTTTTTLSASSSEKSLNLLKFLKPRALSSNSFLERNGLTSSSSSSKSNHHHHHQINGIRMCSSLDCCGVRCNKTIMENVINNTTTKEHLQQQQQQQNDVIWLECDDENIRAITSHELEQELNYKPNSTSTPYLLFYTKVND